MSLILKQAIILCGGLGTRLKPITDSVPKPLAMVNGKPFISYLLHQLKNQGFERVILLTGYLGHMIEEYVEDGSNFGLMVSYSQGPTEWDTGRRIWEVRSQLDPKFLLLYSDNYAPFSLDRIADFHSSVKPAISLSLYKKARGNIHVNSAGSICRYDETRSAGDLSHVEIGYMLVERDEFLVEIEPEVSLSVTLRKLAMKGRLGGLQNYGVYQSISDIDRLRITERHLKVKKILLIDRDGTINARPPKGEYLLDDNHIDYIQSTIDAMEKLAQNGFKFLMISNQAGIGRGLISHEEVEKINLKIKQDLKQRGIDLMGWYICAHGWNDGCECRKPKPELLYRASNDYDICLEQTIYIGDDARDCIAARMAGCKSVLIGSSYEKELAELNFKPDYYGKNLLSILGPIAAFLKYNN